MKKLDIQIVSGDNFIRRVIVDLKSSNLGKKYAIITDSNVKKLYAEKLQKDLKKADIESVIISFPYGEKNKNFQTVEKILDQLFKEEFHRDDAIIALGGGVTGDIAGFTASIYMRGLPYIQIPTTLLAMVDSSIGGKTGIDSKWGKNLIGTFYQPKKVYINPKFLETLPKKQIRNGIAEIIKCGAIARPAILKILNKNKDKIFAFNQKVLSKIINLCVKIKSNFVLADEKENGIRKYLNYGHTIGHAVEKLSKFSVQHGEAVSIGMAMINTIAVSKKIMSKKDSDFIKSLLKLYELPTHLPRTISSIKLIGALSLDKKTENSKRQFVVITKPGKAKISTLITNSDITKACKKHA
ncbi:3-dehydroquinate synthase [bacterium]|nr:3-dehydroquinate synthase [bacterium]